MLGTAVLQPVRGLAYLVSGIGAGAVLFAASVSMSTMATMAKLLLPVRLGAPVLSAAGRLIHMLAGAERVRAALLLDAELSSSPNAKPPDTDARDRRLSVRQDRGLRREFMYCLLLLPCALCATAVVLPVWSAALAGLLAPLYTERVQGGDILPWIRWAPAVETASAFGAGIALALLAPPLTAVLARALLRLATHCLSPRPTDTLQDRIIQLTTSRSGVIDAADAERRRIERDLHDGAQQHLVSLALNLGRAKAKFDSDPTGARGLVHQAHEEAKESISALRQVVQGLHPPILTDRGLDAALSALAARSPVPVRISVDLPQRPTLAVEAVAYFVVSETLTNAARHAAANQITIRVQGDERRLVLVVVDDGRGGAVERPGGGLQGLRERVAAVDGSVDVSSPPSGGTTITVEVPYARRHR